MLPTAWYLEFLLLLKNSTLVVWVQEAWGGIRNRGLLSSAVWIPSFRCWWANLLGKALLESLTQLNFRWGWLAARPDPIGSPSAPPLPSLCGSKFSGQCCYFNPVRQSHFFVPGSGQSPSPWGSLHFMQLGLGIKSFPNSIRQFLLRLLVHLLLLRSLSRRQFSLLLWCFQYGRSIKHLTNLVIQKI